MSSNTVSAPVLPLHTSAMDGLTPDKHVRAPGLPLIYVYGPHPHPLRPANDSTGTSYVFFYDPSVAGKTRVLKTAASLDPPLGSSDPNENHNLIGLKKLEPGDWVFARSIFSVGVAVEDVPKIMIPVINDDLEAKKHDLSRARDAILGDRDSRQDGRAWFETTTRARKLGKGRCYTMGTSLQQAKKTVGPAGAFKYNNPESEMDDALSAVHDFITSSSAYACSAWESTVPSFIKDPLRQRHERIGAPTVGVQENYVWGTFQMNAAQVQSAESQASLEGEMGKFGVKHTDGHDSASSYSSMTVLSDLPPGYDPSRFHFVDMGFYVELHPFTIIFFSGLHSHGGTPPLAPVGEEIPSWAIRLVVIGYPPSLSTAGDVKYPLAYLPDGNVLHLTQEMTGIESTSTRSPVEHTVSTMASEGAIIMTPDSHFLFFVRSLLFLVVYLLGQLPERYHIHLNTDRFLSAFSMTLDGGDTIRPNAWASIPSGNVSDPFGDDVHCESIEGASVTLHNRLVETIPYKGGRRSGTKTVTRGTDTLDEHDEEEEDSDQGDYDQDHDNYDQDQDPQEHDGGEKNKQCADGRHEDDTSACRCFKKQPLYNRATN